MRGKPTASTSSPDLSESRSDVLTRSAPLGRLEIQSFAVLYKRHRSAHTPAVSVGFAPRIRQDVRKPHLRHLFKRNRLLRDAHVVRTNDIHQYAAYRSAPVVHNAPVEVSQPAFGRGAHLNRSPALRARAADQHYPLRPDPRRKPEPRRRTDYLHQVTNAK